MYPCSEIDRLWREDEEGRWKRFPHEDTLFASLSMVKVDKDDTLPLPRLRNPRGVLEMKRGATAVRLAQEVVDCCILSSRPREH